MLTIFWSHKQTLGIYLKRKPNYFFCRVIPFLNRSESVRHSRKKIVMKIFETIKDFILSELAHRAYQVPFTIKIKYR